jgi:hypothetical protein
MKRIEGGVTINIHIHLVLIWTSWAISKPICDMTPGFIRICEGEFGNKIVRTVSLAQYATVTQLVRQGSWEFVCVSDKPDGSGYCFCNNENRISGQLE